MTRDKEARKDSLSTTHKSFLLESRTLFCLTLQPCELPLSHHFANNVNNVLEHRTGCLPGATQQGVLICLALTAPKDSLAHMRMHDSHANICLIAAWARGNAPGPCNGCLPCDLLVVVLVFQRPVGSGRAQASPADLRVLKSEEERE